METSAKNISYYFFRKVRIGGEVVNNLQINFEIKGTPRKRSLSEHLKNTKKHVETGKWMKK